MDQTWDNILYPKDGISYFQYLSFVNFKLFPTHLISSISIQLFVFFFLKIISNFISPKYKYNRFLDPKDIDIIFNGVLIQLPNNNLQNHRII